MKPIGKLEAEIDKDFLNIHLHGRHFSKFIISGKLPHSIYNDIYFFGQSSGDFIILHGKDESSLECLASNEFIEDKEFIKSLYRLLGAKVPENLVNTWVEG